MEQFERIYHHTRWTGRHEMVLIHPEKVLATDAAGHQVVVDKPGLSVVFNRGTYQCNDPKIATLIERDREFKMNIIIALPDAQEFSENAVGAKMGQKMTGVPMQKQLNETVKPQAPLEVPKQAVPTPAPIPAQEAKSTDLERLIQAANVLAGALKEAVQAKVAEAQPQTVQTVQLQQPEVVPEQTQEPKAHPAPVNITPGEVPPGLEQRLPTGVDGEIPFVKRQPHEPEVPRATDQNWQGTPPPANADTVKETGEYAHVIPSGGDGVMRPTQGAMREALDSGMPDVEDLVKQGKPLDGYLEGVGEAFGEETPVPTGVSPQLREMVQGGQPNEVPQPQHVPESSTVTQGSPPLKLEVPGQEEGPGEAVPAPVQAGPSTTPDPEEVIAESRAVAAQLKGQAPTIEKKPSKDADGKRLIYCSICGEGPYRSGRSVGKHRQEQHPETYAAKNK